MLSGVKASLAAKADTLAKAMRYFVRVYKARIQDDPKASPFQTIFQPRMVRCARELTGANAMGIGRRPLWLQEHTEELIVVNLLRAGEEHARAKIADPRAHFGQAFLLRLGSFMYNYLWKPSALLQTHQMIRDRLPSKGQRNWSGEKSFFGHTVGRHTRRRQNLFP